MAEHPIQGLMGVTIEKIRDMVNSETIIGDPIHVDDTTIIPVSRVTFGFASGGSDVGPASSKQMFGGGSGAGRVPRCLQRQCAHRPAGGEGLRRGQCDCLPAGVGRQGCRTDQKRKAGR